MKIVITADPEIPVPPVLYGGIERIIDMLVRGLMTNGHEITLFANPDSEVPCQLIGWTGLKSNSTVGIIQNSGTLLKHVLKNNYDIIHSFSRLAYLLPLMPMKVPKIMSYQREPSIGQISKANKISRSGTLLFTGCSNYISDRINTVACAVTIYNGVPIDFYQPVYSIAKDAPLVFLGRLEHFKGAHLAIDVAKKTGRSLIIAGNIPEESNNYFDMYIRPSLSQTITYVGPVNDQEKNELLGKAVALLMPIQWNEPFGIVMAESMACGTPVIGFDYGAVPEVIENGINGFVCRDVEDMAEKVKQLENLDRNKVRQIAEQRFSDHVIVRNYISAYESMVQINETITN